ncbi:nucleotidyltransferase [Amycolatopsis mediterranei]|uniref:nucleotidyltransferase n=1 Tax=Amycolatopsis mediterranei TaxID=33910 RepID=UPI000AEC829D|nr:nucleotidyltransferase [Amycolatopsis mediterranei]UZF73511.1 hypothetical protein ISP_006958 [Amycolatopsis mediterranei]
MAKTAAQAFDGFKAKLVLTEQQQELVKTRRESTATYLATAFDSTSDMPLARTKLIGSAARSVIIRPIDDIDVMAVFENKDNVFEKYRFDSQTFLYRIRDALSKYKVKVVGARGQAVRLFYQSPPHVDIAPVFKWSGEGTGYGLPNGTGGWLTTNPDFHEEYMNEKNAALGYHLKPLVRMVKRWNNVHSKRLKSWHLEVVAANTFSSLGANSRTASMNFFDWAQTRLYVNDPAGHSGDLSSYLTTQGRADVIASLAAAHGRAVKAVDAETAGNHEEAIRLWRIIYGDEFPAYG